MVNLIFIFQIRNNICKVFSKFIQEGKATIKFKEPAHDLSISKVLNYVVSFTLCRYNWKTGSVF